MASALLLGVHWGTTRAQGFDDLGLSPYPPASRPPAADPTGALHREYEVTFSVVARIRSFAADADYWAGTRLLMGAEQAQAPGGHLALALAGDPEAPWSFYWYKLPMQSPKTGSSAEVSPGAPNWEARRAAERRAETQVRERHREWQRGSGKRDALAFFAPMLVIGAPEGRFRFQLSPSGAVHGIENRVTDRWLPDGWSRWMSGGSETGLGSWEAAGDPPGYAPNGYAALAHALGFLATTPYPAGGPSAARRRPAPGTWQRTVAGIPELAFRTFETLVPKAAGRFEGRGSPTLSYRLEASTGTRLAVAGDSGELAVEGAEGVTYRITRAAAVDASSLAPLEDQVRFAAQRGSDETLEMRIGYRRR